MIIFLSYYAYYVYYAQAYYVIPLIFLLIKTFFPTGIFCGLFDQCIKYDHDKTGDGRTAGGFCGSSD